MTTDNQLAGISGDEREALEAFDEEELAAISRALRADGPVSNIRTVCAALRRLASAPVLSDRELAALVRVRKLHRTEIDTAAAHDDIRLLLDTLERVTGTDSDRLASAPVTAPGVEVVAFGVAEVALGYLEAAGYCTAEEVAHAMEVAGNPDHPLHPQPIGWLLRYPAKIPALTIVSAPDFVRSKARAEYISAAILADYGEPVKATPLYAQAPAPGGVDDDAKACVEAIRDAVQTLVDGNIDRGQAITYITDSLKTYDLRRAENG